MRPVPLLTAGCALILNVLRAAAYDSVVVINEIHYHPAGAGQQEFVELRNLHGVDVNLGGWRLTGGANFDFPAGTVIPGHGYLVLGSVPGALGGLTGSLSNAGETLRLRNQTGRIMDEVEYDDENGWPEGADGSGFTLARKQADASSGPAAWTASRQPGGTPGSANFNPDNTPINHQLVRSEADWRYADAATAPPADWAAAAFNDTAWEQGPAPFRGGPAAAPALTVTANLTERFRASTITGVADGTVITAWPDEAAGDGVSHNATAGTSNPRLRLNATPSGRAVLRFDGNDEMRTSAPPGISATGGFCYWMVLKANSAPLNGLTTNGTGTYFFDRAGSGTPLVSLKTVNGAFGFQKRFDSNTGLGGPAGFTAVSQTAYQIVTVRRNRTAGRFELWVDGVMEASEADTGAALTPDPVNIGRYGVGNTGGLNGDIAEFLIYNSELGTADFQSVGAYLEDEYGLDTAFPGVSSATTVEAAAPVTYYRHAFNYSGDPARTDLRLNFTAADGVVFYLNGTELHRANVPAGPAGHGTAALAAVPAPVESGFVAVPATALVTGQNVLAASLHKATQASATLFDACLEATETFEDPAAARTLVFNEISASWDASFFVELRNASAAAFDAGGWIIRSSGGQSAVLPSSNVPAGGLLAVNAATLGFSPLDGDKLFLMSPGGTRLTDTRTVTTKLRGLAADGTWAVPSAPTPGAENTITPVTGIVINEIFYNALNDGTEQWLELHNITAAPMDLGGWRIADAVTWQFPAGTSIPAGGFLVVAWDPAAFGALHPGVTAQGPWSGNLSGKGETITLQDSTGNIADQVTYADSGRWSHWADGGGSSLELMDPRADNSNPGAWEASDESLATPWQTYTLTGTGAHATTSANANFHEFVMGLLDTGEILIDDISLKEVNQSNRELIQNGSFTAGNADKWRNIGTHRLSTVVDDPFSPGSKVLKISATAAAEHMHNHCETTVKAGSSYVSLNTGSTYNLTFRAKWLRGSNRLHTRLYFNRFARQTELPLPATGGTPGAANSRRVANSGPTLSPASVSPVVPAANEAATVSLYIADPDGVAQVDLFTSVNGAAFTSAAMSGSGGIWTGTIPGKAAGSKVQFYIRATDGAGTSAFWPAAGPQSRAMIPWQDGLSQFITPAGARPHNIRIVLPGSDANIMYRAENVQSNEYTPCTVILNDNRAWYEATMRLKSSEHGRYQQNRVGFNLKFGRDDLFFGAHETISIDRSGNRNTDGLDGTTVTSQREILIKTVMNAAGGIHSMEDDLIRVIPPVATGSPAPAFTGSGAIGQAILSKSRFDDEYLDGQWSDGGRGPMFKQEYVYPLTETINPTTRAVTVIGSSGTMTAAAEQPKVPQTGGSPGPSGINVQAYTPPPGTQPKENYRWHWLIRNGRSGDDYTGLISAITAVGQSNANNFRTQTEAALDVDSWLRAVVCPQLFAVTDNYLATSGATHNFILYFPPGGKGTAIPWDLDYLGQDSSNPNTGIINGGDITKFITDPSRKRRYYGHVLDILNRSFNDAFLTRWATHYSRFGSDDMTSSLVFLRARANYVTSLLNGTNGQTAPVPKVNFTRTSPETMTVGTPFATVTGQGWIDVDTIRIMGSPNPLAVTWTSQTNWSLQLPLNTGTHPYILEAVRPDGSIAGTVSVTVTTSSGISPADAGNIVISRIHYHPSDPTAAELTAGWSSPDDFEYFELMNISANTVDISHCAFGAGITYVFASGTQIPPGGRLAVPRRAAAFASRHPGITSAPEYFIAADPEGNKLSDSGEELSLLSAGGLPIKEFVYDDNFPWPDGADGRGGALVLISPMANPDHGLAWNWAASSVAGGAPGTAPGGIFTGDPGADTNQNGIPDLVDFATGGSGLPDLSYTAASGAPGFQIVVDRDTSVQSSHFIEAATGALSGAGAWTVPDTVTLLTREARSGTVERLTYRITFPPGSARAFVRVRFTSP